MAPVAPPGCANRVVVNRWVGRCVRRPQHLDPKLLEQRARQEFWTPEFLRDLVVDALCTLAIEPLANAEHLVQFVREPDTGWRAATKGTNTRGRDADGGAGSP